MLILFRCSVGEDYPNKCFRDWDLFCNTSSFKKVLSKLKNSEPILKYSPLSGFCSISFENTRWRYFIIRRYLRNINALFHYTFESNKLDDLNITPIYLSLLKNFRNKVFSDFDLIEYFSNELNIIEPYNTLEYLFKSSLIHKINGQNRVNGLSTLLPNFVRKFDNDIVFNKSDNYNNRYSITNINLNHKHLENIINILIEVKDKKDAWEKMLNKPMTLESWLNFEETFFPLAHRMIDYYLYIELDGLLRDYSSLLNPYLIPNEEKKNYQNEFEKQRNSAWGYRLIEACGETNKNIYATILPTIIPYFESGIMRRVFSRGPYRVFPGQNMYKEH